MKEKNITIQYNTGIEKTFTIKNEILFDNFIQWLKDENLLKPCVINNDSGEATWLYKQGINFVNIK